MISFSAYIFGAGCWSCTIGAIFDYPDAIWLGLACVAVALALFLSAEWREQVSARDQLAGPVSRPRLGLTDDEIYDNTAPLSHAVERRAKDREDAV